MKKILIVMHLYFPPHSSLVLIPERPFSYTNVDMENINVILNNNDVSEYLKIAPNGLEVRKLKFLRYILCTTK